MSWPVSSVVHQRMDFVLIARERDVSVSEACRSFKISRKTGYKWLGRYNSEGLPGLADRSRRPSASPLRVSGDVVVRLLALRHRHKHWGPKKLRARLLREGCRPEAVPSVATVGRVLRRTGDSEAKGRGRPPRAVPTKPLLRAERPNDVWTTDFKGWWRTQDGRRCEPLGIRDLCSRYILCLRPVKRRRVEDIRRIFEEVFARYGLPRVIRSDNGSPFASLVGPHGLTRLSAWWRTLGVKQERIVPGHPEQNGSHERMHRDLAREIEAQPAATLREEAGRLEQWREEYNTGRPHEALGMRVPGEVYCCSGRRLSDVTPYVYPSEYIQRRVRRDGCIQIGGRYVYVSSALDKLDVGLERLSDSGWRVWFCDLIIREIDLQQGIFRRPGAASAAQNCNPCPDNKVLPHTGS